MSLRTFISENGDYIFTKKLEVFSRSGKLPKLNEYRDIYDGQTFTMICIHYRSVNVGRE